MENGTIALGFPTSSEDDTVMQQFRYRDHLLNTSNSSVVARYRDVIVPFT